MFLGCDCHWVAELIKKEKEKGSLKTLDLNQGCHKIMQFSTISFTLFCVQYLLFCCDVKMQNCFNNTEFLFHVSMGSFRKK